MTTSTPIDITTSDKYKYSNFSYPNDLFSADSRYGNNFVMFYINVAEESYLAKDKTQVMSINPDRISGALYNENLDTKAIEGAPSLIGGTTAAATIAGSWAKKLLWNGGKIAFGTAGKLFMGGAVASSALLALSEATEGKISRQSKRLKTAIALHVPNNLHIRYSTDWKEEDMLVLGGAAVIANKDIDSFDKAKQISSSAVAASALSIGTGIGAFASVASGLAANPRKEQLFKGVNFREFEMSYEFFPRDSNESNNILNIIRQFKLHMHPEFKDEAAFIYIYPSEFDIMFYHGNDENTTIHKHTSCVLIDLQINYTPNGMFNTFEDGTPTQIDIKLMFKELAILTKKDIEANY